MIAPLSQSNANEGLAVDTRPSDGAQPDLSATSELWGKEDGSWYTSDWIHWTQHPEVKKRINRKVAFREDWDLFCYWVRAYLEDSLPVERALSLGCGIGGLERGLVKYGFARDHLGLDVSQGAIETARKLAADKGLSELRYDVADLNVATLPPDSFDVILGVSAIHHVKELERLFEQIDGSLKDGGLLLMDEFIGPSQFQWHERQIELANRVLRMLPKRFRRSASMPGEIKDHVATHTIEEMNRVDPTESIRSDEIVPLIRQYFDVVEMKGYGGSLLHLILDDIVGNFQPDDPDANSMLQFIFEIEDQGIAAGEIQHDFGAMVARKRSLVSRKKHERLAVGGLGGLVRELPPWPKNLRFDNPQKAE